MQLDLTDRASLVASLPHGGVVAEIGVASGVFSQVILDRNRPSRLVLVDCWERQVGTDYEKDPANGPNQKYHDGMYASVCRRFAGRPEVEIVRAYSVPAAERFPNGLFVLVHLDGNHLIVDQDILAWWPKVKRGGWLTGHDYCVVSGYITVKPAVDAWAAKEGLRVYVAGRSSPDEFERNYPTWAVQKP